MRILLQRSPSRIVVTMRKLPKHFSPDGPAEERMPGTPKARSAADVVRVAEELALPVIGPGRKTITERRSRGLLLVIKRALARSRYLQEKLHDRPTET